jgi:hypothetical protein
MRLLAPKRLGGRARARLPVLVVFAFAIVLTAWVAFRGWPPSDADASQSIRDEERTLIEREVAPLRGEAQVRRYLDTLLARARENGKMTALESSPGFAAIASLRGQLPEEQLGKLREDFNQRVLMTLKEVDPDEYARVTYVPPEFRRPPSP